MVQFVKHKSTITSLPAMVIPAMNLFDRFQNLFDRFQNLFDRFQMGWCADSMERACFCLGSRKFIISAKLNLLSSTI